MSPLVVFTIDERSFALPLACVERAVRAVAVTPLPQAPAIVAGIINVGGRVVPVIDLRRRCGLPAKETDLADQLLLAHTNRRPLAVPVDAVRDVMNCDDSDFVPVDSVVAGTRHLRGIVKSPAGLILIHDLDAFLSLEEAVALDAALPPATASP